MSEKLRLQELYVQSLSACMGVRLCRFAHYTFRTTTGGAAAAAALVQIATTQSCCTGGSPFLLSQELCSNKETSARELDLRTSRGPQDTKRPVFCTSISVLLTSLC